MSPSFDDPRQRPPVPVDESWAWCEIETASGLRLRTNSFEDLPGGCRFVAVIDPEGTQRLWLASPSWADRVTVRAALLRLVAAAGAVEVQDPDFGAEWEVAFAHGALRACPEGTYLRFADGSGEPFDDGSAYWCDDEFVEDPELVMGAVMGVAAHLAR